MTGHALWSHEVELAPEAGSALAARRFVRQHLVSHALPSMADDVELVVSELATNALTHARSRFRISLCLSGQNLMLEVTDDCPGLPQRVRPSALDTTGRGVFITERLSSAWGVRSMPGKGKTVWVSFDPA